MRDFHTAEQLIREFKGRLYTFGSGVLGQVGAVAAELGQRAVLIRPGFSGSEALVASVAESLQAHGVVLQSIVGGARPNAPREDVFRLGDALKSSDADVIVALGGGSLIDAAKAAEVLRTLGGEIDDYFGVGRVSEKLRASGTVLSPLLAVQTVSSSAAHLTKYSNITDLETGQKKLIVDEAIVPPRAVFDYEVTKSTPPGLTADGALDGIAHSLEVLLGAVGRPFYGKAAQIAAETVRLVVNYVQRAVEEPKDAEARTALGLATDLGGYAIMVGGTNGGHLTSFSLVDVLSHGRACAIMNPYYVVFFAPAVEQPLRLVGRIFRQAGLTEADVERLSGRELGVAVAQAMMELSRRIGFPTRLGEVEGFTAAHIDRALAAAKDPQLKMKLENMPVPLTADMVDEYMAPVLHAARTGDLSLVKNVPQG